MMNRFFSGLSTLAAIVFFATTVHAKSSIEITEARILIPLKGTNVTAGYGVLKNDSGQDVVLKIKSAKPFKATELHETYEDAGKMGMRKIEQFVIPAHGTFEMKPGGHHVMLFNPSKDLKLNQDVEIVFDQNGKNLTFKFKVTARETDGSHEHH